MSERDKPLKNRPQPPRPTGGAGKPGGGAPPAKPKPAPPSSSSMKQPPAKPPAKPSAKPPASPPASRPPADRQTPAAAGRGGTPAAARPVIGPAASAAAGAAAGAAAAGGADVERLRTNIESNLKTLADSVAFNNHKRAASDLQSGISGLVEKVASARARGYRYKGYLERKIETLQEKWQAVEPEMRRQLSAAEAELQPLYDQVARDYRNAGDSAARLGAVDRAVTDLQARANAARGSLDAVYGDLRQTYYQTVRQVDEVIALLDLLDQASFSMLAGENPIQAVKARWWRDGDNKGPEGILYLTDQRLLFEQREKVATKKVLFITTESETRQNLLVEVPVGAISSCKSSKRGIGGHQDHLAFEFLQGDYHNAHFHLDGQNSEGWAGLVKRVLSGEIQGERYYADGESQAETQQALDQAIAEAPTQCQACGATLDARLTVGQRQITCDYCGSVMRW